MERYSVTYQQVKNGKAGAMHTTTISASSTMEARNKIKAREAKNGRICRIIAAVKVS